MDNNYKLEICANSARSALIAQTAGADRVELCAGMPEGGTTPSFGEITVARRMLRTTKLHVIIRPRGGDFLYSEVEKQAMLEDILQCRRMGVDGVVFGCLTSQGNVDEDAMKTLLRSARSEDFQGSPLSVTFHRAFDMCREPFQTMETLIGLGVDRILTSGASQTAVQGIPLLKELVSRAAGRIIIMPGCGVNAGNIANIARETGAREFHLSGRSSIGSGMVYRNPNVSMGGTVHIDEYSIDLTSQEKVSAALAALATLPV